MVLISACASRCSSLRGSRAMMARRAESSSVRTMAEELVVILSWWRHRDAARHPSPHVDEFANQTRHSGICGVETEYSWPRI